MEADAAHTVPRTRVTAYEYGTGLACTDWRRRLSSTRHPPPPPPSHLLPPPQPVTTFVFELTIPKTSSTAEQEKDAAQSYLQTFSSRANSNSVLLEMFPSLRASSSGSVRAMTITSATVVQTTSSQESLMFSAPSPPPPPSESSPPPPSSESEVKTAGESAIFIVIAGAIIGCLVLVAALGAGGCYCYKKKKPPSRPANVDIVVSSPSSARDSIGVTVTPTEAARDSTGAIDSEDLTFIAVLASCGLEHHAKLFEDEGYTLEVAFRALDSAQSTLLTDLRDLTLSLGECRRLITQLNAAKNSARSLTVTPTEAEAARDSTGVIRKIYV